MTKTALVDTPRFGTLSYGEHDVVRFPDGLIGFPGSQHFLIIEHREGSDFRWLQNIDEPALALLIVDPSRFVKDYSPEVNESVVSNLQITDATPRLVYTVVNIPKGKPEDMTLNLAGPIVINAENRLAKQLVLEDSRYPLRHRVMDGKGKNSEGEAA